jgi:cytochrome c-type biogenesis protein CcsB
MLLKLSLFSLFAGIALIVLALVCYILVLTLGRSARRQQVSAKATSARANAGGGRSTTGLLAPPAEVGRPNALALAATRLSQLAFLFLTACVVFRTIETGRGPFGNQYEFAVAFGWGMIAAYVYFEHKYHVRTLALVIHPITAAMLVYAISVGDIANPLPPALQNSLLLTIHVLVAIIAYGAFSVSFAAAGLYLIQPAEGRKGLPKLALLDQIGYRAVIIGFPLLTLVLVLGAIWAQIAWGTYWSWDPKETASLLTWLIYGAYLHARVARGWVGRRASWLLILGFAAVMFTFFGNLFFTGMHSYA